jgi:hypothetical protein
MLFIIYIDPCCIDVRLLFDKASCNFSAGMDKNNNNMLHPCQFKLGFGTQSLS